MFGMLPSESAITMFKRFAPLRDYLGVKLNRKVLLETAKDYNEFASRTDERRYDIISTAPHMALRALDSGIYELAATFVKPLRAVVIVAQDSPAQTLKDLIGQTIATPPENAIITMVGKQYLRQQSSQDNDYRFVSYRTHNAAWNAALGGETGAAIIANFIYLKAKKQNKPMRLLAESESFPSMGILVASDLPDDIKALVKKTFISMKDEADGRVLLKTISQPGYGEASAAGFETLRPFIFTVDKLPK